jgi:hypothetical protein
MIIHIFYQFVSFGEPGVDRRIILRWIFRKWGLGGMGGIKLVQDRNRRRKFVNDVMNFQFPQNAGNLLSN